MFSFCSFFFVDSSAIVHHPGLLVSDGLVAISLGPLGEWVWSAAFAWGSSRSAVDAGRRAGDIGGGIRVRSASRPLSTSGGTLELEAVGVVDEAVADGVGDGRVAEVLVPRFGRQLAGDDRGGVAVAVFEDVQKALTLWLLCITSTVVAVTLTSIFSWTSPCGTE